MVNPVTTIVKSMRTKSDRRKAEKAKKSVQRDLERKHGKGTPEYYEAYNRHLYGDEQYEFIKNHPGGTSERGRYLAGSQSDGGSPQKTTEKSTPNISIDVVSAAEAPTTFRPSPQETIHQNNIFSPTSKDVPRDEIRMGPGGEYAPGASTKEEILRQRSGPPTNETSIFTPSQPGQGFQERRIISSQETISVESEGLRILEEERGRAIIDAPLKQSQRLSELIVGPTENIPKTETGPRAAASAIEWAITLPAETLRSPVTMTETITDIREVGFMKAAGEAGKTIMEDPSGAGVKAGLTAALIVLPAAKVVRAARAPGRSGRTTAYELTTGPEDIPATRVDYITDFVFTAENKGIRGRGMVAMETKGAEAALDVRSFTVPEGKSFKTTVEARRVTRSRMDLATGDRITGTVVSEEIPKGTKSRGTFKSIKQEGQLDILGKPQPKQELSMRSGVVQETPGVDLGVGVRNMKKSTLAQPVKKTVDVSGTKLISEVRTPKGLRRKTYVREAVIDKKALEDRFMDDIFKDLGVSQDTLRGPPKSDISQGGQGIKISTKDMVMAERAMQQTASAFQKTHTPKPTPKTRPLTTPGKTAQDVIISRPATGLGSIPRQQKISEEEMQMVRYPPSEGPPGAVQDRVIDLDIATGLGSARIAAQTQIQSERSRSRRKTRAEQNIGLSVDSEVSLSMRQDIAQQQAQDLVSDQKTQQRTRQQLMIPTTPPQRTLGRQLIPNISVPKTPRTPWLLPPPVLSLGMRTTSGVPKGIRPPGRGFIYTPSLGGMLSGRELQKAPVGAVTGLELRPPVKKKKRR